LFLGYNILKACRYPFEMNHLFVIKSLESIDEAYL